MLPNKLYQQLVHPSKSLLGWVVTRFFLWHHRLAQENAVKLLQIQPDDTVLEVGFGPGLGLRAAAPLLTGPKGKLIGVDYSEYMVSKASQAVKKHIASGKVTLIRGDVVAMPLPDNSIDKVYHCNTSCHWPDLKAATSELHRVMKPGALMVTTFKLRSLKCAVYLNSVKGDNWKPEVYMETLSATGFNDVWMQELKEGRTYFQAIFATASK
ncbi:SMT2 methyltransferase, partial [Amia calva]|nr:SMT2 methyltransferase [Amia calva]